LFAATEQWAGARPDEAWSICTAPHADLFVWEFFAPLLAGARGVFVPPVVARMPDRLVRLLERERIAVLNTTAGTFAGLVQADAERTPNLCLRSVIVRGEAPSADVLDGWRARHPDGPRLFAVHGSAETGIHAMWRELDPADSGSFGRPLPDLSIYVLDAQGEPAPFGVPGDLYVGGAGLAYGYINRADLARERFVPHPFMPGERLFRTRTRARWLEDGTLDGDVAPVVHPREAECRASAVAHAALRFAGTAPLRLRGRPPLPQRERGPSPCRER
jgi:non-ribosomal peptide synthetase component F